MSVSSFSSVFGSTRIDPTGSSWRLDVELRMEDPGYEVHLEVQGMVAALAPVWLGRIDFPQAVKCGDDEVCGAPRYRTALSSWLGVTHFAAAANSPTRA